MKKILILICTLLCANVLLAQTEFIVGNLKYIVSSSNQVSVKAANTTITTANIPATVSYNGTTYSVTSIGDFAFSYCSSLTSVTIGNSVTSIGDEAFSYCRSLTSITIPNSVTSIGNSAFHYCDSLTSITIPNSVTSIGDYAFCVCSSLTSVTIPNSVTSIGYKAFYNCSSLTSVTCLRSNSPSLGWDVFDGTPNNKTLTIPCGCEYTDWQNETTWASIDCIVTIGSRFTIGDLTYEITSETEVKVQACTESATSVVIPETVTYQGTTYSVTSIGYNAFLNCSSLTSVTIGNSVTSIIERAFAGCSSLTSVTIPNSVTYIGDQAFYGCSSLTSITIPNSVTYIGDYTFRGCSSLTSITIPNSVTYIGDQAFYNCSSLTSIDIPNSITSIGNQAFRSCSSLTSVTIPNSVTSIGDGAFFECSSLTSIDIPNSVTSIGTHAFYGCSSLTSVTIPNSVTSIGNQAFRSCSSLTSVTIPNSVTSIGDGAFYDCSSLTSIDIPNSITSIGEMTFAYCSSLTSVTIPDSVTSIGNSAFYNCSSLTSVTIPNSVTSIGNSAFYNCSSLTSVTIPNSITSIGEMTFAYCSSLTSVTIPNSVTYIGIGAFAWCSSLTSVTIPNSVTYIGDGAFYDCSSLTTLNFNAINCNDFILDTPPFLGCPIVTINIGDSVQRIPNYFAYDCDDLTSIAIPNSVTYIGGSAFKSCSSLTSVTIPNSVTYIGDQAFYSCSSLTSMTVDMNNIPNLSNIGPNSTLQNLTLGENVASIASGAFSSSSFLQNVTCLATTPPTIADNTVFPYPNIATLTVPCGSLEAYSAPTSFWNMFFAGRISENGYNVVATANDNAFGSVAVESDCSTAMLTATANEGYVFLSWNDGNTENPRVVSLTSDTSFVANFIISTVNTDITATICQGQTYIENGFNVSEAGTYTQTLTAINGADSIVTLTLNVNPIFNTELIASICEGQTYAENGFNISEAGVYTQTLTSVNGCDSIVTLTLNVNPIFNTELSATICEGQVYTENNFNISEAGVYTQTLTSVNGCDSIVTLTLNILPSYNTNLTATICQGSELNISGFNVSEAGVYTQNLTSVNGCDSIVTLTVTELPIIHTDLTLTICEGTSLNFSGFNVSEAGVYTQTHTAVNGCDSIVTLTVTELPTVHTDLTLTICEGTSLNFSGFNVSEAGIYTQTHTSVNGCDSIVTLTVSVNPTFDTTITATINAGEMYSEFGFNESEAGTYVQNLQTVNGCDSTITLILDVNSSLLDIEQTEITLYPNPTNSKITFSSTIESIEVIDLTGRCVLTFSNAREINIESLPAGAYYLRLTNNDKAIMRKVIKE